MLNDLDGDEADHPRERDPAHAITTEQSSNRPDARIERSISELLETASTSLSSPVTGSSHPTTSLLFTPLSLSREMSYHPAPTGDHASDDPRPVTTAEESPSSPEGLMPLTMGKPEDERARKQTEFTYTPTVAGSSTSVAESETETTSDEQIPASFEEAGSVASQRTQRVDFTGLVLANLGKDDITQQSRPPPSNTATSNHAQGSGETSIGQSIESAAVSTQSPPLRIASVCPDTVLAHPQPLARSDSTVKSQAVDSRSHALLGNIAQLEATAEKLSEASANASTSVSTGASDIDTAIRELHGELKRSDSRRSSILAATVGTPPADDAEEVANSLAQLKRHLSNASSSIISTNNAARQGGYSPAAFVRSPTQTYPSWFAAASSRGQPEPPHTDAEHGGLLRLSPDKASVRSVKSPKMTLSEISESEPIALDGGAFAKADAASPLELPDRDMDKGHHPAMETAMPSTDMFHDMLGDGRGEGGDLDLRLRLDSPAIHAPHPAAEPEIQRRWSVHSNDTFEQARHAFDDFDGVHWEANEDDYYEPPDHEPNLPAPVPRPRNERPQSYFDHETGQQMLYYPARVPAMLNLPPKLSSKPSSEVRNVRRSHVLGAMAGMNQEAAKARHKDSVRKRQSVIPEFSFMKESRQSQLEIQGDQMDALAALTANDPAGEGEGGEHMGLEPDFLGHATEGIAHPSENAMPAGALRRPQRLTDKRKSRMSHMDGINPHVRASAFFDTSPQRPGIAVVKDGSAMATLDSFLDASAEAPVSAFTDHAFAGKLGQEVYGKERSRRSLAPAASLAPVSSERDVKRKTSSFMRLGKKASTQFSDAQTKSLSRYSALDNEEHEDGRRRSSQSGDDDGDAESFVYRLHGEASHPDNNEGDEDDENDEDDHKNASDSDEAAYHGAPTTLLAELQLRKQQQQNRTQHLTKAFPQGMHATLLEMDAVAEAQRKERKDKRVNLAWEEPYAHLDQNGSDDEDVPLAYIAAKNAGAKNMADMERPLGLMERRDMEENEPLSRRKARLQSGTTTAAAAAAAATMTSSEMMLKAQSVVDLSTTRLAGIHRHSPAASRVVITPDPAMASYVPDDEEDEEETLAERRKRLAGEEEEAVKTRLPPTRPVSRAFSEELLSEFSAPSKPKVDDAAVVDRGASKTPLNLEGEEETMGQRRKRLQAEREARAHEMSYSALTGDSGSGSARPGTPGSLSRRLGLPGVLSAQDSRKRREDDDKRRETDAKMAQMRMQARGAMYDNSQQRLAMHQGGISSFGGAYAMNNYSTGNTSMNGFPNAQMGFGAAAANAGVGVRPVTQGFSMMNMPNHPPGIQQYPLHMQTMPVQMGMPTSGNMNGGGGVDMNRVEKWRQGVSP